MSNPLAKAVSARVELTLEDGTRYTVRLAHTAEHPLQAELAIENEDRDLPSDTGWVERELTGRQFVGLRLTGLATDLQRWP